MFSTKESEDPIFIKEYKVLHLYNYRAWSDRLAPIRMSSPPESHFKESSGRYRASPSINHTCA